MKKLSIVSGIVFAVLFLAGCGQNTENTVESAAEDEIDYPTDTIEWIIPYAPGGTTDSSARVLSEKISEYLPNDERVIIVNKEGGNGTIGLSDLNQAEPDGYTIGTVTSTIIGLEPHFSDVNYTHDGFEPISKLITLHQFLIADKDATYDTFDEFLEYAKENPGMQFATTGVNNGPHLNTEAFAEEANLDMSAVPYDGGGPALTALRSGEVEAAVTANVDPTQVKPIFTIATQRSPFFEDVPTLEELGYDIDGSEMVGVMAPSGTPKEIIEILDNAFEQALQDPETIEALENLELAVDYGGPEQLQEEINEAYENFEKLVQD